MYLKHSGESKETQESEGPLDGLVQLYIVVIECGLVSLGWTLTFNGVSHERVVALTIIPSKLRVASCVNITSTLHEAHLVAPPGEVAPVGLKVLEENFIEFQVFTHFNQDLAGPDTLVAGNSLVPLSLAESHCTHIDTNVKNGTLFGRSIFHFNSGQPCIFIARQQMDTTLL